MTLAYVINIIEGVAVPGWVEMPSGGGGLPSGTAKRMMYYNNTAWVTTARLEYEETTIGANSFVLWGKNNPSTNHLSLYQLLTEAQFYWTANNGSQKFIARGEENYSRLHLSFDATKSFDIWMGNTGYNGISYKSNNSYFQIVNSSSTDNVVFKVNTTSGINGGSVEIGGINCKVNLKIHKLSGTDNALLQTDTSGNISRSTMPILQRAIVDVGDVAIKALHDGAAAVPLQIIAAPGAGKYISINKIRMLFAAGDTSYNGLDASIYIGLSDSMYWTLIAIDGAVDRMLDTAQALAGNADNYINQPVSIWMGGQSTVGNGTLKIIVDYEIIEI